MASVKLAKRVSRKDIKKKVKGDDGVKSVRSKEKAGQGLPVPAKSTEKKSATKSDEKTIGKDSKAASNVNVAKEVSRVGAEIQKQQVASYESDLELALERVKRRQVGDAVSALLQHARLHADKVTAAKKKLDLFEGGEDENAASNGESFANGKDFILVSFCMRTVPQKVSFKMHRVTISHPFHTLDDDDLDICLLVKDKEEAERWLADSGKLTSIRKVISLQQLRTSYQTFQQRRDLAACYDVFLADDRIINMLPKTLGRVFMNTNKRPLPLRLAQKGQVSGSLHARVKRSIESAYISISAGTNVTMRAARWRWSDEKKIVDNVLDCIAGGAARIPGKWENIVSVHLKTGNSAALPVYASLPETVALESEESKSTPKTANVASAESSKDKVRSTKKRKSIDDEVKKGKEKLSKTKASAKENVLNESVANSSNRRTKKRKS